MSRTTYAPPVPEQDSWNPQTLPLGSASTAAIELLQPLVAPEQDFHQLPKRYLRSRAVVRRWLPGGGREQVFLTAMSLLIGDVLALIGCFLAVHLLASNFVPLHNPRQLFLDCIELTIAYAVIGYFMGLFPATATSPVFELRQLVSASFASVCLMLIVTTSLLPISSTQYLTAFVAGMVGVVTLPLVRTALRHLLARFSWWGERAIVVGTGVQGQAIYRFYQRSPHRGLRPVGLVDSAEILDSEPSQPRDPKIPYLGSVNELKWLTNRPHAHWGIIAPGGCDGLNVAEVLRFSGQFRKVVILPTGISLPSLWSHSRECAGVVGVQVVNHLRNPLFITVKRTVDIIGSGTALILSLPLFLVAIVWIKSVSAGPAFFSQERVGRGGRRFKAWKFRTMVTDAESVLEEYLENDPDLRQEWMTYQKLKNDPRIIKGVGGFLRKSSLDELPQLWNIFRGDMSLVGPRPCMGNQIGLYGNAYPVYKSVRPGLTGMWQISGRNHTSYDQRVRFDCYYVSNWSLWLDIYILMRTVKTILWREGAY